MSDPNDAARRLFFEAPSEPWWSGTAIKEIRHQPIVVGGRTHVTLFAQGEQDGGRSHPRMQTAMKPAADPQPRSGLFTGLAPWTSSIQLRSDLDTLVQRHRDYLLALNLPDVQPPVGGERYFQNSIAGQRREAFLVEAAAHLSRSVELGLLTEEEELACRRVLREGEDRLFSGTMAFDDVDIGTYFSFMQDDPFVHYLEYMLDSLPGPEAARTLLPEAGAEAVRRQIQQIQNHLDFLMRKKYAYNGIIEADIERSLGGFLVDRATRAIVSERPESASLPLPEYELLQLADDSPSPHRGCYLYRSVEGLHLEDGTPVQTEEGHIRQRPLEAATLTFRRAPGDPRLRPDLRFDWDEDGYITSQEIPWIHWSGYCDVRAVMEALGLTFSPDHEVFEYRSDTGQTAVYTPRLLLEMAASVIALGNTYRNLETGVLYQETNRYQGGRRHASLSDRLIIEAENGARFAWPPDPRTDLFRIAAVKCNGIDLDLEALFLQYIPILDPLNIVKNDRFVEISKDGLNVIHLDAAVIEAEFDFHHFSEKQGALEKYRSTVNIDLESPGAGQFLLGTSAGEPGQRERRIVTLDTQAREVIVAVERYELRDETWTPVLDPDATRRIPLPGAWTIRLERQVARDDPALFGRLLATALRKGQNINADSAVLEPVWNGTVSAISSELLASNPATGVEYWSVQVNARFGNSVLDYLLRRGPDGSPEAYCPAPGRRGWGTPPDFLWQEFPDVGSKGLKDGAWVVNEEMRRRGIVFLEPQIDLEGGVYVRDEHIKNIFEILFCSLAGYRHTVVHANRRYGFTEATKWHETIAHLEQGRGQILGRAE